MEDETLQSVQLVHDGIQDQRNWIPLSKKDMEEYRSH